MWFGVVSDHTSGCQQVVEQDVVLYYFVLYYLCGQFADPNCSTVSHKF